MTNIEKIVIESEKLDFVSIVDFEKTIMKLLRSDAKAILLDMKNVEYADSRAIGMFVSFKLQFDSKDKFFALFNLTSDVKYIFRVTSVDTAIKIFDDEESAIKAAENYI